MAAESVQSPMKQVEARKAQRFRCEVPTSCQPPSWSKDPWPGTIRDISTTGMSLTLNRRFECGSGLAIQIPAEDGTTSTIFARVSHIRPVGPGLWQMGCKFISELGDDEVRQVLQFESLLQADGDDLPKPSPGARAVNDVLFQAHLEPGELLRWFVKRLELSDTWPLPRDKIIAMRIGGVSKQAPPIELRIRRCKQFGAYWIIDGQFLRRPADEVFTALTAPPPVVY